MKKTLGIVKNSLMATSLSLLLASTAQADMINVETDKEASRFLMQATFGPTTQSIKKLKELETYEAWIDEQFKKPISLIAPKLEALNIEDETIKHMQAAWWSNVIKNDDQLRQRMAYALSEIFVTNKAPGFGRLTIEREYYYDILSKNAFGNYKDILKEVTLNPIMARFLSMLNNKKADPQKNTHPDENYAREIMQLFTIGLVELRKNGKIKTKDGVEIPTYSQEDVAQLARVFTGWQLSSRRNYIDPMVCNPSNHDFGEKKLLGKTIPANLSCEEDLDHAINILFEHKNTPVFVAKQLIQRFTTSNPSRKYVKAVANKFIDNGDGVRGDLKAVIKEILLFDGARKQWNFKRVFGKTKEPIIRLAGLLRATNALKDRDITETNSVYSYFGQTHLDAPSVFNYFRPTYAPKGAVTNANKVAPELQLATDKYIVNTSNYYEYLTRKINVKRNKKLHIQLDEELELVKNNPEAFVEHFNILLFSGHMKDNTKKVIIEHIESIPYYSNKESKIYKVSRKRAAEALFLMMNSPEQNYVQ